MATATPNVKAIVQRALQDLPDDVTWEEVHQAMWTWQSIERGLADIRAGRLTDHDEFMRELLAHAPLVSRPY